MRRYLAKLKSALDTVETLRDVLNDIDQGHNVPPERLSSARLELAHLQAALNSAHPPSKFEEVDGLLKSVGAFASTALDLASKSTGEVPKNASSAAAGALMMLDRALAQLDQNDSAKDQFAALLVGW
jgi:phytoene/squalene synthetase